MKQRASAEELNYKILGMKARLRRLNAKTRRPERDPSSGFPSGLLVLFLLCGLRFLGILLFALLGLVFLAHLVAHEETPFLLRQL